MSCTLTQPSAARTGLEPDTDAERAAARRRITARLAGFRTPEGLIPVCSWCRRIRNEAGSWTSVERDLLDGLEMPLTHGVCPECAKTHFPGMHTQEGARMRAAGSQRLTTARLESC